MQERTRERPGSLVESHKSYDPRIIFFYFVVSGLLLVLVGGLAFQQLWRAGSYQEREKHQNQRRIIVPGPRGNIYDREGRLLVGNRPLFAVTLSLDELGAEIWHEYLRIRSNYRDLGDKDIPSAPELKKIARYSVVQRYLDTVNRALHREEKVDAKELKEHFEKQLILPFVLLADLKPEEYAELLEQLPVVSPMQIYASSVRFYPYGSAAAHALGYVGSTDEVDSEDLPGKGLRTFKVKSTVGKAGLESRFDEQLQGEAGGSIYRVSPGGYRIEPALEKRPPVQGKSLYTSLDIDLQLAAEQAIGDQTGAAVVLDVATGEVLALTSKPDYDLNKFSPRISTETWTDAEERKAFLNRATQGLYPPGSTFKILVAIAGLRSGAISPETDTADCEGTLTVGKHLFNCENGLGRHGVIALREAISVSCDIYFFTYGLKTSVDTIATEAKRFGLDKPTGIEIGEVKKMIIPDPAWKKEARLGGWLPGDTANMSIGQGYVWLTPLEMACFAASVGRNETITKPTLLHSDTPRLQHSSPIGLAPEQRSALLDGMEQCIISPHGTGRMLSTSKYKIQGLRIAGKTGTAQVPGKLNIAWFIGFAPIEKPEIAFAIAVEGDTPGENFAGGSYAVPVAAEVLKTWWAKKNRLPATSKLAASADPERPRPAEPR